MDSEFIVKENIYSGYFDLLLFFKVDIIFKIYGVDVTDVSFETKDTGYGT